MRNRFDEQLDVLNVELIKMGSLCEAAIAGAVSAFKDGDYATRQEVFSLDNEIGQKERDIETICMKLLLQQQPVARDLRMITSALKMISDMKRIGKQCADIAEISGMEIEEEVRSSQNINEMSKATIRMVAGSIESFVKSDLQLAVYIYNYDDVVDDLFDRVKKDLVRLIAQDPDYGSSCIDLLMIAKYFERIGDHATNISEWVQYSITGERMVRTIKK